MKKPDYNTTREHILQAALPMQTKTYKPISHQQLMDLTLESIGAAGFQLDKELYSAGNGGNVATGKYTISNVADTEMQLQIAWQNSYDKSVSLKFAIGTRIMVCSNGCVSGDYGAFKKKHVGSVQTFTPTAITEYIKQAGDAFKQMQIARDTMKQIEITKRQKAEFIGRLMIEEQVIGSLQVNSIVRELSDPTFDYGAPDSLWELYQYTTQSMRETHPSTWMSDHIKAHSFFVNAAGILVTPVEISVPEPASLEQLELF